MMRFRFLHFGLLTFFLNLTLAPTNLALASPSTSEFKVSKITIKKINCKIEQKQTVFEGLTKPYKPYNLNTKKTQLIACQHVQLGQDEFYTSQFVNFDEENLKPSKVLIFEVAALNQKTKSLNTVRSEVIDRVILDGDLPDYNFENIFKVEWGRSKNDQQPMMRFEISGRDKTEKPFAYLLKLNKKNDWFENVF